MKKQPFILSVLSMLTLAISVSGDLVRYTFEGTISSIEAYTITDNTLLSYTLLPQAFEHRLGDAVIYEFLVDTDLPATSPGLPSGTLPNNTWTAEYFFADFVGGALIDEATSGSLDHSLGSTYVFNNLPGNAIDTSRTISLSAENSDFLLTVYNNIDSIGTWGVDTLIWGLESYFVEDEGTGITTGTIFYSNMRIASIEPLSTTVPEPSTGILLPGGLVCLFGAARLRRASRHAQKQ